VGHLGVSLWDPFFYCGQGGVEVSMFTFLECLLASKSQIFFGVIKVTSLKHELTVGSL
jgi:hypothetical protein